MNEVLLDYTTIMNKCLNKRNMARYSDCYFDRDINKYMWVLSYDIIECFRSILYAGVYSSHFYSPEKNVYQLMGINVKIDNDSNNIIKLYKEV